MTANAEAHADHVADEIRRTQDEMGETVQQIEEKLQPPKLIQAIAGNDREETVNEALRLIRKNPIAAAMIAVGVVWLIASTSRRKTTDTTHDDSEFNLRTEEPAPLRGSIAPESEREPRRAMSF